MEEEEIESWYEEQKQKLLDQYMEKLEKGYDKEKAEKEYTLAFNMTSAKYNSLIEKSILQGGKKSKLRDMYDKTKERVRGILRR